MRSLTWTAVWARRLARHALRERAPAADLAGVVGAVCGIQAQVMPAAELAIGIRVADVTRSTVRAALWEERRLVKTFGLRGTVHLFPAAELPLWMAALRAAKAANAATDAKRLASVGLDFDKRAAIVAAIGDALDGRCLTLRQLGDAVVARTGAWAGEVAGAAWSAGWPRWRMVLGSAAVAGRLCYGPPAGQEVTFVRPDQWTRAWQDVDPSTALAEVFRRYLHAYGPATPRDFAQWFALPLEAARALVPVLGDALEEADVEGDRGFLPAADAADGALPAAESVRLLPHFDCYVIGCHPRARLLPGAWAARVPARTTPSQLPTLLIDGVVAGVWERRAQGRRVEVRVEPFAPLSAGQEALLAAEAARVGAILEAPATLAVGPIAIRPHL